MFVRSHKVRIGVLLSDLLWHGMVQRPAMGKETGKAKDFCVGRNALKNLGNGQSLNHNVFHTLIGIDLLERFAAGGDAGIRQTLVSKIAANISKPYRR